MGLPVGRFPSEVLLRPVLAPGGTALTDRARSRSVAGERLRSRHLTETRLLRTTAANRAGSFAARCPLDNPVVAYATTVRHGRGVINPKHISHPIRCIALPVRDWTGSRRNPRSRLAIRSRCNRDRVPSAVIWGKTASGRVAESSASWKSDGEHARSPNAPRGSRPREPWASFPQAIKTLGFSRIQLHHEKVACSDDAVGDRAPCLRRQIHGEFKRITDRIRRPR